jgi:hypothetical protein
MVMATIAGVHLGCFGSTLGTAGCGEVLFIAPRSKRLLANQATPAATPETSQFLRGSRRCPGPAAAEGQLHDATDPAGCSHSPLWG